ncbi:MAG TPA: chromosome partition protein MukE [Bacteroidia bacterium]|jgi:hypothetical protein|nr:chromosome partition protein MukE [Bacteroidia bacterium]
MEDEYQGTHEKGYAFLEDEKVKQYFADINIELLQGKHIQRDDYYPFLILSSNEPDFKFFYQNLYGLNLIKDKKDNETYFYLDFPEDGKGKLSPSSRYRELTQIQTIIGIVLMNMYYERYFEQIKQITWSDLKKEILEGEYAANYQRIFFKGQRGNFTDIEWEEVRSSIKRVLKSFAALGWIDMQQQDDAEISFVLKPAINRFAKLYKDELEHFEDFVNKIVPQNI